MDEPADAGTTALLDGRLRVRQPEAGHRAGTDAVLLAASAPLWPGVGVVDAGAGVGTVGLMLALREPTARVDLIESHEGLAAMARHNVVLNDVAGRVRVHAADLFDPSLRGCLVRRPELAVSNPPFFRATGHRPSPDPLRARAHVLSDDPARAGHGGWLRALLALLAPHGLAVLIHRPDALPALLRAAEGRLGGVTVRPVHAHAGGDAIRVIVGGVAGSRAPLRFVEPLVLHGEDGRFTPLADALHRGRAELPLLRPRKSRPTGPAR